jgi:polyisoprenoid-binding protein YceI
VDKIINRPRANNSTVTTLITRGRRECGAAIARLISGTARYRRGADRVPGSAYRRRPLLALALAGLLLPAPAGAAQLYTIDPRFGRIEFTVSHLGLFTSHGEFRRFDSRLTIDQAHPEQTRISVAVDAGSIDMAWDGAVELLRSADYFDTARYPKLSFSSTKVVAESADRYKVLGTLEIRGVSRPFTLEATLTDRHSDPATHGEVADFVVSGELLRSAFGMTADPVFISDRVEIRIIARIRLADPAHAG